LKNDEISPNVNSWVLQHVTVFVGGKDFNHLRAPIWDDDDGGDED